MPGDEVLVVVGADDVGLALARRAGTSLVVLADPDEGAGLCAAETLRQHGVTASVVVTDTRQPESVAVLAFTAARLGRVTGLVHAARSRPGATVAEILAVDLVGVALVLQEFARVVSPGGAGLVVAGAGGRDAVVSRDLADAVMDVPPLELLDLPMFQPELVPDAGRAHALAQHCAVLRVQAASWQWSRRQARVNAVSPDRTAHPEDVAATGEFLLSPAARHVTGTDLLLDGGRAAAVAAGHEPRTPLFPRQDLRAEPVRVPRRVV